MMNFVVQVRTIETTGAGKKHVSNMTMDAASFEDAHSIKTSMQRTSSNVLNRECIICVAITTHASNRVFIPTDNLPELITSLEKALDSMTAKPGPAKLIHR